MLKVACPYSAISPLLASREVSAAVVFPIDEFLVPGGQGDAATLLDSGRRDLSAKLSKPFSAYERPITSPGVERAVTRSVSANGDLTLLTLCPGPQMSDARALAKVVVGSHVLVCHRLRVARSC